MNILHVIPGLTYERGGPSTVLEALVQCQVDGGHSVQVLTTDQGIANGEHPVRLSDAAELERLPIRGPDRWAYSPLFTASLRERLHRCDVVHVHSIFNYPTDAACRWAHRLERPCILRPCGLLHPRALAFGKWKKRLFLKLWGSRGLHTVSAFHCTTEREEEMSRPQFFGMPSFVVPNGVWADEYCVLDRPAARQMVSEQFGLGKNPFVLYLGRIHPKKGLDVLLPAFQKGAPAGHRLVIAGPDEGGYGGKIRHLSERLGLQTRTIFTGLVQGETKRALLAAAELVVLPSRYENFGNTVIESLAAGTPVLLSEHVDLYPDVCEAEVGWSASLTTENWALQLADCLASPLLLRSAGARASQWTRAHFDWPSVNRLLEENYHAIIAGRAIPLPHLPSRA